MARPGRSRRHPRVREAAAPGHAPSSTAGIACVVYGSDAIIEVLRGRAKVIRAVRALEESGVSTYCTPIAWAEVYAGIPAEKSC